VRLPWKTRGPGRNPVGERPANPALQATAKRRAATERRSRYANGHPTEVHDADITKTNTGQKDGSVVSTNARTASSPDQLSILLGSTSRRPAEPVAKRTRQKVDALSGSSATQQDATYSTEPGLTRGEIPGRMEIWEFWLLSGRKGLRGGRKRAAFWRNAQADACGSKEV